jgi:hypothetical protein
MVVKSFAIFAISRRSRETSPTQQKPRPVARAGFLRPGRCLPGGGGQRRANLLLRCLSRTTARTVALRHHHRVDGVDNAVGCRNVGCGDR